MSPRGGGIVVGTLCIAAGLLILVVWVCTATVGAS